jgi:hypothetical protein
MSPMPVTSPDVKDRVSNLGRNGTMEYTVMEMMGDYPPEDQENWDWIGPLDDAITLARMTYDLSTAKDNPSYYIVVRELLYNDDKVEFLLHQNIEYRGQEATNKANELAKEDM